MKPIQHNPTRGQPRDTAARGLPALEPKVRPERNPRRIQWRDPFTRRCTTDRMFEPLLLPFRIARHALVDWWRDWVAMAAINLAWLVCCATIVLAPPATFALFHYMREVQRGRGTDPRELLAVGRRHFVKSWLWFLANVLFGGLVWVSLVFYSRIEAPVAVAVYVVLFVVVGLWLAVQFYALPYLVVQSEPNLRLAHRNALFTALASPVYTLVLLGICAFVAALGARLIFLVFLGAPCLIAMIATHAVRERLDAFGVEERQAS